MAGKKMPMNMPQDPTENMESPSMQRQEAKMMRPSAGRGRPAFGGFKAPSFKKKK